MIGSDHDGQRLLQALRDGAVGGARRRVTRGVVVGENHRSRVMSQCSADDFARVDFRPVHYSPKHRLDGNDAVASIKKEHMEFFLVECADAHPQEVAGGAGIAAFAQTFKTLSQDAFRLAQDADLVEHVAAEGVVSRGEVELLTRSTGGRLLLRRLRLVLALSLRKPRLILADSSSRVGWW